MMNNLEIQPMLTTDPLELYVECPRERMDELMNAMRKLTKRPWMFWETHYNGSFSPPDASFDFARFDFDDQPITTNLSIKYQGQLRWSKQTDFNVLLVWEIGIDGKTSIEENNFLIQDFNDTIAGPACEELGLHSTLGAGAWRDRLK